MSEELKKRIMGAIHKGEVTMRPRWHFVLRASLYALGIIVVALAALFLSSFILFLLRQSGVYFAPLFGLHGLRSFFFALPWLLLSVTLLFIVVLEVLSRFYGIGRRTPLLYSALAIIAFVLCATFIIGKTTFHEQMSVRAMNGGLPVFGRMYRSFPEPTNIHRGRVTEISDGGFILMGRRGGTTSIMIGPTTRLPHGIDFAEEDVVVVIGENVDGMVMAEGVMEVSPEMFDPNGRGMKGKHHFKLERAPILSE